MLRIQEMFTQYMPTRAHREMDGAHYNVSDFFKKVHMGRNARKPVLGGLGTTKAQTSLRISAFVIRFFGSIICKLAIGEISIF